MSFNTGAQFNPPPMTRPQQEPPNADHPGAEEHAAPPYTTAPPPAYPLARINSFLAHGGPLDETISVPMILSREKQRKRDMFHPFGGFGGGRGVVTQTVIVRKMTRSHYLEHYAKDSEGNYVGTGKRAVDAGLVFVPGKSTPEDLLKQVEEVAFGKQHDGRDFAHSWGVSGPTGGAYAGASF
ncbi:hypothetical protein P153DRAFT_204496 [Dothidotthia symphoricarpi CBS 119687]|uniref:Uncharacterized protein n=1 Tax=Dothidotthia symphoricarpi CBS 119687 TaxID=1392245 RepID=A0A6A6AFL5_9PLEO|nr:uncharacterized protein P153DRAFT_204496 [Dothidotthia symphoricarpi CBS 119687]KAF2130762.1 hypothetical protein P153DRAFT_204496 [Dothidotthia symphoricarpi CBS 119687]